MIFRKSKEFLKLVEVVIETSELVVDLKKTITTELAGYKIDNESLKNENDDLRLKLIENEKKIKDLESNLNLEKSKVFKAEENIDKLLKKYKTVCNAKGGLTKHNNKLKLDYKKLQQEYEEYKNNSYSKTTLPPDELPKAEPMKLKRSGAKGAANAILRHKNERV